MERTNLIILREDDLLAARDQLELFSEDHALITEVIFDLLIGRQLNPSILEDLDQIDGVVSAEIVDTTAPGDDSAELIEKAISNLREAHRIFAEVRAKAARSGYSIEEVKEAAARRLDAA